MILEYEVGHEVEHGRPNNRLEGAKYLCGYNSSYRVSCIVKAIDIIKDESDRDYNNNNRHKSELSGVFNDDAFDQVGNMFAFIDRFFDIADDLL